MTPPSKPRQKPAAPRNAGRNRPLQERIDLVLKATEIVGQTTDRMALELAHQMGRPIRYGGEFGGFNERVRYMADVAAECLAPTVIEDSDAFLRELKRIPWGVVLVVAPWNYPYMTAINTIAPALIAGNTVILKHAAQTLQVGERLAEAFHEAGVPDDVFQNVVLDHDTTVGTDRRTSRRFRELHRLGRRRSGDRTRRGGHLHSGLDRTRRQGSGLRPRRRRSRRRRRHADGRRDVQFGPVLLRDRADIRGTVAVSMPSSRKPSPGSTPRSSATRSTRKPRSVRWPTSASPAKSAPRSTRRWPTAPRRISRRCAADDGGAYVTPQILTNVTHDMRVMRDESFGPVVGIMPVDDDDEAIAPDERQPLRPDRVDLDQRPRRRRSASATGIETGTVFMNRCDYLDPALCWTGCKDTGRGAGLSKLAYQALTRPKSYHLKKV